MYKGKRITVIIPCLDEEEGIAHVLQSMPTLVDEVIVVDNGSMDRTGEVARSLGAYVVREDIRGFEHASGDVIITLDGDHSYPADALSYLLEAFDHLNADFLSASRFPIQDSQAMSFKHQLGNLALSVATSLLFFRWVRDSQSGMWVFSRHILPLMKLESDGMAFSEEIKIEAMRNGKIRFREIIINYSSRVGEKKLQPWRDGFRNLMWLFKKRFLR